MTTPNSTPNLVPCHCFSIRSLRCGRFRRDGDVNAAIRIGASLTTHAISNIPAVALMSATSVWGFCRRSENVSIYTAISILYSSFLVFFFSFFISTNHLGMCQVTLASFCALFTDKTKENDRRL